MASTRGEGRARRRAVGRAPRSNAAFPSPAVGAVGTCEVPTTQSPARKNEKKESLVYALATSDRTKVKIGTTVNLKRRMRDLTQGTEGALDLIATWSGGRALERWFHDTFAAYRIHHEWFRHEGALREAIERYTTSPTVDPLAHCAKPPTTTSEVSSTTSDPQPAVELSTERPARRSRSLAVSRALCRRSFRAFVTRMWPVVEQTRDLLPSVAIDVICQALQATVDHGVNRLAIACPPGVSKSLLCSVLYPAWILLRTDGKARVMAGSYSWDFSTRDSRRCRDLVQSAEYAALVGGRWSIRTDVNKLDDWWTTAGGRRLITSVDGKSTGERVDFQIIDDALSAADRLSESTRKEAARWITEVLPSRLDDPKRAVRVVVGQRLAVDDPVGVVLADPNWRYCRLPAVLSAEDEPTELRATDGKIIWRDNREPGQPLFAMLDLVDLERLKGEHGSGPYAAQYLQAPTDDSTATVKRAWWRFHHAPHVAPTADRPAGCVDTPAAPTPADFDRYVIACDLTFGSTKGDYAVVTCWASKGAARYLLALWRRRAGLLESVAAIKSMAEQYPTAKIIIEKAANGAGAVEELGAAGVPNVIPMPPLGNKATRLGLVSATIEAGSCHLPLGASWLGDFVEELAGSTKHDDQQDVTAYAIHDLNSSSSSYEDAISKLGGVSGNPFVGAWNRDTGYW